MTDFEAMIRERELQIIDYAFEQAFEQLLTDEDYYEIVAMARELAIFELF